MLSLAWEPGRVDAGITRGPKELWRSSSWKAGRAEDRSHFGPEAEISGDISTGQKVLEMKVRKASALREQLKLGRTGEAEKH